jgi:CMP-N-acetylneuraminic acid synthetase
MRTLALIPARAGSKGIPGKNTRDFNGAPLLCWAINTAFLSKVPAWLYVSTDSEEIADLAASWGALWPIMRPAELAQDDTPMLAVVQHALAEVEQRGIVPDVVMLLQPTQPLRTYQHLIDALRLLEETGADSVVSVVQIPAHYSPDYACSIWHGGLHPWEEGEVWDNLPARRQDARPAYSRDGTVYAIKRETIESGSLYGSHCVPLIIPSHESVNLDTEEDWNRAEALVRK